MVKKLRLSFEKGGAHCVFPRTLCLSVVDLSRIRGGRSRDRNREYYEFNFSGRHFRSQQRLRNSFLVVIEYDLATRHSWKIRIVIDRW
ncbi:hypothetical protein ALC53_01522 [Atta colombica]|uniref:Uncharacterized protein n=1 Tax=Atta colombica TaxID=520822 RepID=A0A195BTQ3_9HYME|nr:hypothetical protein ALC53_01522 [Atta colombica]